MSRVQEAYREWFKATNSGRGVPTPREEQVWEAAYAAALQAAEEALEELFDTAYQPGVSAALDSVRLLQEEVLL